MFLKSQTPFPTPIKWKEYPIGPLGSSFRRLPPGYKAKFKVSKKNFPKKYRSSPVFFETPNTLSCTNKMDRVFNWTPWELLSESPSEGYSNFKDQKRPTLVCIFETPNTPSYTNKMERVFNWTPWELLSQTPSGGWNTSRSQKNCLKIVCFETPNTLT